MGRGGKPQSTTDIKEKHILGVPNNTQKWFTRGRLKNRLFSEKGVYGSATFTSKAGYELLGANFLTC